MVDSFDDFAKKRAQQQQDREKVKKDTKPEWVALMGFAESLAQDGKGVDDFKFEWVPDAYSPQLILGAVAATFLERPTPGNVEYRVRFCRKPAGLNKSWIDDAPFEPEDWTLIPTTGVGDDIQWMSAEANAQLNRQVSFSSSDLAGRVGIKLAELLDVYNKAFPNWNLGSTA